MVVSCECSDDVYVGEVIGATCNCIPGNEEFMTSSFLNCQRYQLDQVQGTTNGTILAVGQCQFEQYDSFSTNLCSNLETSFGM